MEPVDLTCTTGGTSGKDFGIQIHTWTLPAAPDEPESQFVFPLGAVSVYDHPFHSYHHNVSQPSGSSATRC